MTDGTYLPEACIAPGCSNRIAVTRANRITLCCGFVWEVAPVCDLHAGAPVGDSLVCAWCNLNTETLNLDLRDRAAVNWWLAMEVPLYVPPF